jgi:hypothetical protein
MTPLGNTAGASASAYALNPVLEVVAEQPNKTYSGGQTRDSKERAFRQTPHDRSKLERARPFRAAWPESDTRRERDQTHARNRLVTEFRLRLAEWKRATSRINSPAEMVIHPSCDALLAVGTKPEVSALIMEELRTAPGIVVFVLHRLYESKPYSDADRGNIWRMSKSWVTWYDDQNSPVAGTEVLNP